MSSRVHPAPSLRHLLPFQSRWLSDVSRFKAGLWSRQTGKDYTATAEVVQDCQLRPKTTWLIAAPSERQSLETLAKCTEWNPAFALNVVETSVERSGGSRSLLKCATVQYSNGSRILAVPGRPETVRGFSANILATEFHFFDDDEATWRALLPSIANAARGSEKRVRVISTPNGKQGRFYKIVDEAALNSRSHRPAAWKVHRVTIHDAIGEGLSLDPEELRQSLDDPDGWAQEFECDFVDTSHVLLPYDIIAHAESDDATELGDPSFFDSTFGGGPVVCGTDFGRTNDPTINWTLQQVGDAWVTREVLVLKGLSSPEQQRLLTARYRRATRVCYDYTGPGIGLGDYLVEDRSGGGFGEYNPARHQFGKIELCTFTASLKREIFPKLRRAFEAPVRLRIPISIAVREDLHAMRQVIRAGEYSYSAPRTAEGHSDRCTALALAWRAATNEAPTGAFTTASLAASCLGQPVMAPFARPPLV